MPDLFNIHEHPDTSPDAPQDWRVAFAAVPMETPPGDGWAGLVRKLDAQASSRGRARRERRTTWLIGVASAAVLVVAAWSPLSRWSQADADQAPAPAAMTAAKASRGPAPAIEPDKAGTPTERVETAPARKAVATRETAPTVHRKSTRGLREAPGKPGLASQEPTLQPVTQAVSPEQDPGSDIAKATLAASDADPLQKLKSQSAQLEALVALARDDRIGNAGSELLSGELDAGIAEIDASLSQADLTAPRKQDLWQQRVDLLQQLAGVEATSRWLAAHGASNDTALVSVD